MSIALSIREPKKDRPMEIPLKIEDAKNLQLWNHRLIAWRWIVLAAACLVVFVWKQNASPDTVSKMFSILTILFVLNIVLWRVLQARRLASCSPQRFLLGQVWMPSLFLENLRKLKTCAPLRENG